MGADALLRSPVCTWLLLREEREERGSTASPPKY